MDRKQLEAALESSSCKEEDKYFFDQPFVRECFDNTVMKMASHGWSLIDFEVYEMLDLKTAIKMGFVYITYKDELPLKSLTSRFIVVDETTAKLID